MKKLRGLIGGRWLCLVAVGFDQFKQTLLVYFSHESWIFFSFNINLTFKRRQTWFIYSGSWKSKDDEINVCGIHKVPIHSFFMILTLLWHSALVIFKYTQTNTYEIDGKFLRHVTYYVYYRCGLLMDSPLNIWKWQNLTYATNDMCNGKRNHNHIKPHQ